MPKVSRRRLASTVVAQLRQNPTNQRHIMLTLAAYLITHKQQKHMDLLLLDIASELKRTDAHLYAEVTSAFPLDASARTELTRYLQQATSARTVEFDEHVDPELLTGVVVSTAEQEMDTSARTKLTKLQSLNVNMSREA